MAHSAQQRMRWLPGRLWRRGELISHGSLVARGVLVARGLAFAAGAVVLAFPCIAQQPIHVSARETIKAGRSLFQKEWKHESPRLPPQGNMSNQQYESLLQRMGGDGLGPMFNAKSCEACHLGGAGAGVDRNVTLITLDPRSPSLTAATAQLSRTRTIPPIAAQALEKEIDSLFPAFISPVGELALDVVVHEDSTREFYQPIRDQLADGVAQGIAPEWFNSAERTSRAIAEQPVVAGRRGGLDYYLSQRNSPPLFGLGLIDRIDMSRLLNIARVQATRSSGKISGRVGDGKFGWRAQTTSLHSFVMGACAGELGLQVPGTSQPPDLADFSYISLGNDLHQRDVTQLVSYVAALPAPIQERTGVEHWNGVRHGKRLFATAGCAACHVENVSPAKGIYSDLLLHDMGHLLQAPAPASRGQLSKLRRISMPRFPRDNRPLGSGASVASYYGGGSVIEAFAFQRPLEAQFPYGKLPNAATDPKNEIRVTWDAMQREWRTPPLWGVADSAPYLHDGRAETLEAAIRWHGGEATDSITQYRSLAKNDQRLIVQFLRSLRSPGMAGAPQQVQRNEPQELAKRAAPAKPKPSDDDPLAALQNAY